MRDEPTTLLALYTVASIVTPLIRNRRSVPSDAANHWSGPRSRRVVRKGPRVSRDYPSTGSGTVPVGLRMPPSDR